MCILTKNGNWFRSSQRQYESLEGKSSDYPERPSQAHVLSGGGFLQVSQAVCWIDIPTFREAHSTQTQMWALMGLWFLQLMSLQWKGIPCMLLCNWEGRTQAPPWEGTDPHWESENGLQPPRGEPKCSRPRFLVTQPGGGGVSGERKSCVLTTNSARDKLGQYSAQEKALPWMLRADYIKNKCGLV